MNYALRQLIIDRLHQHGQAATYSAVAGLVGGVARSLMGDLPRCPRNSWVVAMANGRPTRYRPNQEDPRLIPSVEQHGVLETPEALNQWLATHP